MSITAIVKDKELTPLTNIVSSEAVINLIYPVGSIYTSLDSSFDPNKSWVGTTWEKISSGKYIRATNTEADVGKDVAAGLPDITGSINARAGYLWGANGCFSKGATGTTVLQAQNGTDASYESFFKASASNSIYGKSNTVTPESIDAFIWKRVG